MDLLHRLAIVLSLLVGTSLFAACSSGGGGGSDGLAVSGTNSTLEVSASTGTLADGTEVVTITVTVRDTGGAVMAGKTVQLAATGVGNTLTQPTTTTNASGVATGTLTSSVAETKTVSAIVSPGANQVALATTADTTFIPAISAGNSTIAVDNDFGTVADGVESVTVTVTVRDVFGVVVPGQEVELASTGVGNTLTQPTGPTNAGGVATGTLATTMAELKTLSAVINPGASEVALDDTADTEFVWHLPNTYFVRESGSDSNAGDSPAEAWGTIGHAASLMVPGDTIYVGAGTYSESVAFTTSGTLNDPIFVIADTSGDYTSDSGAVLVDAAGGSFALHLDGVSNIGVQGFTVIGATPGAPGGGGIWTSNNCDSVILSNIIAYENDRGIHLQDTDNSYLEGCRISNNLSGDGDGLVFEGADTISVRNNLVYNNARYGIHLKANANLMTVQANTLYMNGDDQVRVASGSLAVIDDCIIADGADDGIYRDGASGLVEHHNAFWNNAGFAYNRDGVDWALGTGDLETDPLLVDPDGGDNQLGGAEGVDDVFLVGTDSPTIDAGSVNASTVTLFFGGAMTGFTSRSDGILEGSSPDGALLNLGHHVPADVSPIGSLSSDDARLFYGSGDDVQVLGRIWDDATSTWLPPTLADPIEGTVKWVISKVSPLLRQDELLATFSDNGASTELSVRLWNGRFWSEAGGFDDPIDCQVLPANANQRSFDIEYENTSGDAMVVYSNNDNNPVFRTHGLGVWSAEAPVFASPDDYGTGTALWVELAARPNSDEIALVFLTDDSDLVAVIWDGDSWDEAGTGTLLDSTIATTTLSQAFDLAYETLSGDLLVTWGHTNLIEEVRYAVKPAGSDTFTNADVNSAEAIGAIVRLAADPGSDQIACALSEGSLDDDTVGMIWNGSAFVHIAEFDLTAAADCKDVAVSWVGSSGVAVFVYKDADGGGTLDWARYTVTGWQVQADQALPGIGDLEFIQGQSFPVQDKAMFVMSDDTASLFALTYNGATWTITNGGAALETDLSDLGTSSQPFHFALKE